MGTLATNYVFGFSDFLYSEVCKVYKYWDGVLNTRNTQEASLMPSYDNNNNT